MFVSGLRQGPLTSPFPAVGTFQNLLATLYFSNPGKPILSLRHTAHFW